MFKLDKLFAHLTLAALTIFFAQLSYAQNSQGTAKFPGIGRNATPAEVIAWDIDVRPDFKGLPKGSGSVEQGQAIWESKCASCHGVFGESNEIFTPIAGGTTIDDIKTGKVASLADRKQPQRTTLMKVPTVSTLWDYIFRAMPWNAPRSLTFDETYALVAYILSLGEIVPDDFILSNTNIAEVQKKMPNRNGMTRNHGFWSVTGKPDINSTACMNNCVKFVQIGSSLPDFARNAHGNIAEQNRQYGPNRGSDSTKPPIDKLPGSSGVGLAHAADTHTSTTKGPAALFKNENCSACHAPNAKLVGPSIADIAAKYKGQSGAQEKLMAKVKNGGSGVWGAIPMPPQSQLSDEDRANLVRWVLTGQ
ncbi:c-type cytochrome [Polynucleobacter wuianus]|uniref:c-type cytochrome n=1 Tax=Polynucleobacter wuianus TaxID=1743168 RepID=UPI001C0E5CFC|nr:c-type cytochrome [Polynucleobacter wuianus]MBU3609413.1 c-type cytochrome [Polynucleobacter wuianus]